MITLNFKGEFRGAESKAWEKDGKSGFNYRILVECGVTPYQLETTKEVVEMFDKGVLAKGDECIFTAYYEPRWQYGNFRITGADPIHNK